VIQHGWHLFPLTPCPLPRGEGELPADFREYDDSSHGMAHGAWAVASSDWNCSRTMNRGRSQSLREEDTSALTPGPLPQERENRRQSQSQPMVPVGGKFMGRTP